MPKIKSMAKVRVNPLIGQLSGRIGNIVLVGQADGRTYMRERTRPENPNSLAQQQARTALKRAVASYKALTIEQHQEWGIYAMLQANAPAARQSVVQQFMKLAIKFAQVNPEREIPNLPPPQAFGGDSVAILVNAVGGQLFFSSTNKNAEAVVTEILVQKVASLFTRPIAQKYRLQAFWTFNQNTFAMIKAPGCYACAVRFVNANTGQAGEILSLGVVKIMS